MQAQWWSWLDSVTMRDVGTLLFGLSMVAGGIMGAVRGWHRWMTPWLTRFRLMLVDWSGVPDRPGVPGRDGVMKQLEAHGKELTKQSGLLDEHTKQLSELQARMTPVEKSAHSAAFNSVPNHGTSFADEILRQFKALNQRLDHIEGEKRAE